MAELKNKKIVLEDGSEYYGFGFGCDCESICELVFNTSMVGYQEIISDPSYTDQAVVMTYPLIGNYGIADEDYESRVPTIGGLIVREYNDLPSNFRYTKTLAEVMEEYRIPGIYGLDTRSLTRHIRNNGTCRALITSADTPAGEAAARIKAAPVPCDAVSRVSCKKRWYSRTPNPKYNAVVVDCGLKLSMVRALNSRGCNVTVVPWNTPAAQIEQMKPDGIFISDGPGSPENVTPVTELIGSLRGKYPIFGAGLGHQLICLACGCKVFRLKFGHRGGNHPIRDTETGNIVIAAQNHSYAADAESLAGTGLEITHINLLDSTVEGVCSKKDRLYSVQFQPENAPGTSETNLYDRFIAVMQEEKENA